MKIIFFGSSNYCLPVLNSLISNFELSNVITKQNSSVQKFSQQKNIAVFTPNNKEDLISLKDQISTLKPDLAIVADYGLLIPKEIFEIPKHKTLNIHFSRLPKLRGPSPVQYTILYGENEAWISVIIMDEDIDTGDVIWQKEINIMNHETMIQCNNETAGSLYQKLFDIASQELPDVINRYVRNELKPQKQDHTKATYTKHFNRSDGYIPAQLLDMAIKGIQLTKEQLSKWKLFNEILSKLPTKNHTLPTIIDHALRALSPWPGLWTEVSMKQLTNDTMLQKKRLKILRASLEPLASKGLTLRGYRLVLDIVQSEGKKPVSWKQFLEGHPDFSF